MGLSGVALALCYMRTDGAGVAVVHRLFAAFRIGHAVMHALLMQRPAIESRL